MTTILLITPTGAPALGVPTSVADIHDPHVAWDTYLVLHDIPLSIPSGQMVALTGANGSSRSTLLHALLATVPIIQGSVRLFDVGNQGSRVVSWKRVGYVPQCISLGGPISASFPEVVISGLLGRRKWQNFLADKSKAMATLRRVGLVHRAKSPLAILSGDQAQRVPITQALVRDPELLVMGEPIAGIDQVSKERLAQIVSESKNATIATLVVLHELGELGSFLNREPHIGSGYVSYNGALHILDDREQHADEGGHHHTYPAAPTDPALVDDILKRAQ